MGRLSVLLFLGLFLSASPVLAQFDIASLNGQGLGITLTPQHPQPETETTASINNYTSAYYGSTIIWQINGEEVENSRNQTEIVFDSAQAGDLQRLEAILTTPNGQQFTLKRTLEPKWVDIILEPQTYTPGRYRGRALPTIGSVVNATALVSDNRVLEGTYLYTWRVNREVLEGGPIRSSRLVSFEVPYGESFVLSVQVSTVDGVVLGSRTVLVPVQKPEMQFYEVSSLFGMSPMALSDTHIMSGNSAAIVGVPYYLDSRIYNNPAVLDWRINNSPTSNTGDNPYEVVVKRQTSGFGSARLELNVQDTSQVLQKASGAVEITF